MRAETADPTIADLLRRHPKIESVVSGPSQGISFESAGRSRCVLVDSPGELLFGLTELMDNNPMVCADTVSVPSAIGTLALIALGPLIEAGILIEAPTMIVNRSAEDGSLDSTLQRVGWMEGIALHAEPMDLQNVVGATVMAAIQTPSDLSDIDALFDERYGRSFFVRRDEDSSWDTSLVSGLNHAVYRIRIAADEPHSLLTIQLMADEKGKCGAAQVVHAFNVMCGFEESLGLI